MFAEPNSKVCVYGSTPSLTPMLLKEVEHVRSFETENMEIDFQDSYRHSSNGKLSSNFWEISMFYKISNHAIKYIV